MKRRNGGETPRRLPVFKDYTVDVRLREFRKADYQRGLLEFVRFDSPKGRKLLERMRRSQSGTPNPKRRENGADRTAHSRTARKRGVPAGGDAVDRRLGLSGFH